METRHLLRPLSSLSSSTTTTATASAMSSSTSPFTRSIVAAATGRRHQSTTSRTKKMLKIPPHPDFLTPREGESHIIYNPPSAAPSVYHTPFKFLPKTDPRRQANLTQLIRSSADLSGPSANANNLPPPSTKREGAPKMYNVTREQVDEMRTLRAEDPAKWSVQKLAERYKCSHLFIMMCCKAGPEHKAQERERLEAIKARWGPIRSGAREERKKRKALLFKGAI
ncbi:Uu.00g106900.m01.CDS01 [Anthostomella pinea]|uniref:Uu.00g106900.m01.CDS01 n=1 Tax=Anthostomella pinea TaxID=933095 RepID=A0AAI8YDI3_9PEZI|nr:Uu.00g106900.m01.CDS01 [Anthostomella pinea]